MKSRGLTLIELSIALALAAVLFSVAVIAVGALTGAKAKSAAGELGGVIRSLYDTAALSGKTCRLVFQLPGTREEEAVRYWAECARGAVTTTRDRDGALREAELLQKEEQRQRERGGRAKEQRFTAYGSSGSGEPTLQDLLAEQKERVEQTGRFSQFNSPEIEPRELPAGVSVSIWTRHQHDVVKSGPAYLYFFPQGYTEKAHVYVRQGSNVWTLVVSPLTGKTSVVTEELEVPRS